MLDRQSDWYLCDSYLETLFGISELGHRFASRVIGFREPLGLVTVKVKPTCAIRSIKNFSWLFFNFFF